MQEARVMEPNPLRELIVGVNHRVPVRDGRKVVYANLDNAASTPALKAVKQEADQLLEWYASIHRGAGYKSQLASEWYELARQDILEFIGADPDTYCAIFTSNTTDAINRLARKFPVDADRSVIISWAEHHANDLPWRERGRVLRTPVNDEGWIDPDHLDTVLQREGRRARLVSVTGAANVNGTVQPIGELARVAHRHGIPLAVDAAQLAPHRAIRLNDMAEEERPDFLMFSGHKMYAPFGGGALVGRREFFDRTAPAVRGGGAVRLVEPDGVDWLDAPEREEAGSPNVLGAVTLAAAARELQRIGFEEMDQVEMILTRRLLQALERIPGSIIYGITDTARMQDRLAVVSFNLEGIDHALVAGVLAYEGGIGVRNGCFCAQPFVMQMLGLTQEQAFAFRDKMRNGHKIGIPGSVRISFGLYNTNEELDHALMLLQALAEGEFRDAYRQDPSTGAFHPADGVPSYSDHIHELRMEEPAFWAGRNHTRFP
ncbi:aminotransferase class V-fold PLP-dependent enzyme [bacterium]|nr:aminotransferase class V-fold PLP-dependent enzyme [bacterium]